MRLVEEMTLGIFGTLTGSMVTLAWKSSSDLQLDVKKRDLGVFASFPFPVA